MKLIKLFAIAGVLHLHAAFNLTWSLPGISLDVNPPVGDSAFNASIAMNPSGNAIAAWGRTSGGGTKEDVYVASFQQSSRVWTGAVKVSKADAAYASVGIDDLGNAIVIWEEGFSAQIMTRTLSASGVWAPSLDLPPQVVFNTPSAQSKPQLVVNGKGEALAIWEQQDGKFCHIHAAKRNIDGVWIDLGKISDSKTNAKLHTPSAISINTLGEALAVWEEKNKDSQLVKGAYFNGMKFDAPILVSNPNNIAKQSVVKIDKLGDGIFVWCEDGKVLSRRFSKKKISQEILCVSNPASFCQYPVIGIDDEQNAYVVFERYAGQITQDAKFKFISGAKLNMKENQWSSSQDISVPSMEPSNAGRPVLSINGLGDGVALWKEYDGQNMSIQGAGFSMGSWSSIKRLSSNQENSGPKFPFYDVGITINNHGDIMAVWPEDTSGNGSQQIKAAFGVGVASISVNPPKKDETQQEEIKYDEDLLLPVEDEKISDDKNKNEEIVIVSSDASKEDKTSLGETGNASKDKHKEDKGISGSTNTDKTKDSKNDPIVILPKLSSVDVAKGKQIVHRFPAHADVINVLSWTASEGALYYRVYRENLRSQIAEIQNTFFEDHNRKFGERVIYLITAVDQYGYESSPFTLIVNP